MIAFSHFSQLAAFFVFWLGASSGSFLNVLICRFTQHLLKSKDAGFDSEEKFSFLKSARGRSKCPLCHKSLCWFELIPVLSFIIQKGRCRRCKEKISRQYIIVEILSAAVFLLIALKFWNFPFLILLWWFIALFLILLSAIDFFHYLIPDNLIKIFFAVGIFLILIQYIPFSTFNFQLSTFNFNYLGYYQHLFPQFKSLLLNHLLGLFSFSSLLFIISMASGEKYMGMGDAKLMAVLGLILGWPAIILVFILSFLAGAFIGLILMLFKKKSFASAVPFGPFIAGSALAVALYGEEILRIYFRIAGL